MATYKTTELFGIISDAIATNHLYIDVSELEADDESPATLSFSIPEDDLSYEDEAVSVDVDSDFDETRLLIKATDIAPISFTFDEISTLKLAVDNALEYIKEESKKPSYSKEVLSDMKTSSVAIRNLQAKLNKFCSLMD